MFCVGRFFHFEFVHDAGIEMEIDMTFQAGLVSGSYFISVLGSVTALQVRTAWDTVLDFLSHLH